MSIDTFGPYQPRPETYPYEAYKKLYNAAKTLGIPPIFTATYTGVDEYNYATVMFHYEYDDKGTMKNGQSTFSFYPSDVDWMTLFKVYDIKKLRGRGMRNHKELMEEQIEKLTSDVLWSIIDIVYDPENANKFMINPSLLIIDVKGVHRSVEGSLLVSLMYNTSGYEYEYNLGPIKWDRSNHKADIPTGTYRFNDLENYVKVISFHPPDTLESVGNKYRKLLDTAITQWKSPK